MSNIQVLTKSNLIALLPSLNAKFNTKLNNDDALTTAELEEIWLDYFNPYVTVTITQSDNQTIHVLINNETDYTETFSERTGAEYSITVVPDTAYTAGTVTNSTGILSEAMIISATPAVPITFNMANYAHNITDYNSITSLPQENITELTNIILSANARGAFDFCYQLTSLSNVEQTWNTSIVTDMSNMFENCESLTTLDVSNWDTGSVIDMSGLFLNCESLTSLDVSDWDTSSVTGIGSMFFGCTALATLNVSNWDTSSVTSMYRLFFNCDSLTSLDLSNWDTSSVTTSNAYAGMEEMFQGCDSLTVLDVSNFETTSTTNVTNIFASTPLQYLIIGSSTFKFQLGQSIPVWHTCKILVPHALIPTYQAATGWSEHASQFDAIENYTITRSNGQVTVTPISA